MFEIYITENNTHSRRRLLGTYRLSELSDAVQYFARNMRDDQILVIEKIEFKEE